MYVMGAIAILCMTHGYLYYTGWPLGTGSYILKCPS